MDSKPISHPRPLSPHLGIYRFKLHMAVSIFHRITGCAMALSTPLLVVWFWTLAYNAEYFELINGFLKSILGQLMLIGWTLAFFFHLGNGIRHLFWDTGRGFALDTVTKSGLSVILFSIIFTAATWGCIYYRMGALS